MASLPEQNIFSMRIVCIDYYMAPPIPDVDFCYSSFHGRKVDEVPVIRIYGSTLSGQKTCMHIHRALPYLYVPCSDAPIRSHQEGRTYSQLISHSLENALKLKTSLDSKKQHVHGCSLVRARRFYGCHLAEELFVKIYLYYPHEVSRAASLFLDGAVLNKYFQPYESHIPYLLQFQIDNNLYGMGLLHLSKVKFRHPTPDHFISQEACYRKQSIHSMVNLSCDLANHKADSSSQFPEGTAVWLSSTIPSVWMWPSPAFDLQRSVPKRQSTCQLEGDAIVDDIVNQQFKMYTSLSQRSGVKLVQSLIPIWEEEYHRTGKLEAVRSPDPRKPLPEKVLKNFSHGLELEKALLGLYEEAQSLLSSQASSLEGAEKFMQSIHSISDVGSLPTDKEISNDGNSNGTFSEDLLEGNENGFSSRQGFTYEVDEQQCESLPKDNCSPLYLTNESVDRKVVDEDTLGLLRWMASSQAMEDLCSDDNLVNEAILSPLLPTTTMEKVLEKAHLDYEIESQQECQDILDSIDVVRDKLDTSTLEQVIPQVDGSSDEQFMTPDVAIPTKLPEEKDLWGALPFPNSQRMPEDSGYYDEKKHDSKFEDYEKNADKHWNYSLDNSDKYILAQGNVEFNCSLRELMRKKRGQRAESSEDENHGSKKRLPVKGKSPRVTVTYYDHKRYGQLPFSALSGASKGEGVANSDNVEDLNRKPINTNQSFNLRQQEGGAGTACRGPECCFSGKLCMPSRTASSDDCSCNCNLPVVASLRNSDEVDNQLGYRGETTCSEITANADLAFGAQHLEFGDNKNDVHGNQNCFSEDVAVWTSSYDVKDCMECTEMTLSKKPPPLDVINKNIKNISAFNGLYFQDLMKNVDSFDAEGTTADSTSLCFYSSFLEGNKYSYKSESYEETSNICREKSLGIPTHCLNDGSCLYLLTPACSPPSLGSVHHWLLQQAPQKTRNVFTEVVEGNEAARVVPLSPKYDETKIEPPASSNDQMASCSADGHLFEKFLSSAKPIVHSGGLIDSQLMETKALPGKKVIVENQDKINHDNGRKCFENWQEVSQISGPELKSKITPLSQTGFRDPAAVGASQQLTLLSIEVVANSRGDLRPDPRHDAVNIIALAIQEDSSNLLEVHVLVRGSDEGKCDRNIDGVAGCKVEIFAEEKCMLDQFVKIIYLFDPDILVGWEIQGGSLGFLAERAAHLGVHLLKTISRTPVVQTNVLVCDSVNSEIRVGENYVHEALADSVIVENAVIEDEWGRTHASGLHVGGRIVLNLWRIMSSELKLNMYTIEAVSEAVLRRKVPLFPFKTLMTWFSSGSAGARFRCIRYAVERVKLNFEIINQLDMVNRTAELARIYGIDFFSVLSRGSQYRVESMYLRLAHTQNYLSVSPGNQQVVSQPAMECLPLVMEPESGYYVDPVVVLDFQSLYPSMIIAYNLCYCTCLGKVTPSKTNQLGVSTYTPDLQLLVDLKDEILLTPNGVMYVPHKVRKGVLPCMLEEILSTRIMVKQAMKNLTSSRQILFRIFNARQLALKLIANVTYGYTAAGFSGRMPCAELADSIVQCGRRTLETAISFVNSHSTWNARVIYGDTDSMFVLLKGQTLEEAFRIGQDIASEITAMNPNPVTLKMEKIYYPCVLLTKKRYVGYSYETLDQVKPTFDAKGIETIRRDTCGAVAKTLEQSLQILFESDSIFPVKEYLERQWSRILCGKISLKDFVFSKEVRLGTYRASSLPPAALVATKAMKVDPRAEPHYAERVPYVVVHGEPGARLIDMVVDPLDLLDVNSSYRLNDQYYIRKQIIPALQRVFGLLGADLNKWYLEMPRPVKPAIAKRHFSGTNMECTYELGDDKQWISRKPFGSRTRIDYYYLSKHCVLCGELVQVSSYLCERCSRNGPLLATALVSKTSKLERDAQHLAGICLHCGGGGDIADSGVKCMSLACSVFYERSKVQKELQALSGVAADAGLYPKCNVEWF